MISDFVSSKFTGPAAPRLVTEGLQAESGQSFMALLGDALNPLQHIPVVSQVYRAVTGDTIEPASQVVTGAVLGGPLGGLMSLASAIVGELWDSSSATDEAIIKVADNNPARPDIFKV